MKYICLQSIDGKFYSNCNEEESKMKVGDILKCSEDVQYEILGFANTNEEAQKILYPNEQDFTRALIDYLRNIQRILR